MKKLLLSLILITLNALSSFGQLKISHEKFSLRIASCFESDTLDITINGKELVKNVIVTSDFSTSITDLAIYQDAAGLWVLHKNERTKQERLEMSKMIKIDIRINGVLTSKNINLKKGWILMLDNCMGETARVVKVTQHKKTVILE